MSVAFEQQPDKGTALIDKDGRANQRFFRWLFQINSLFTKGFTGTVTTAKLTGVGTNGSMTFQNGILVSQTPAT